MRGKFEEKNFLYHMGKAYYFLNILYKIKSMNKKNPLENRSSWSKKIPVI